MFGGNFPGFTAGGQDNGADQMDGFRRLADDVDVIMMRDPATRFGDFPKA